MGDTKMDGRGAAGTIVSFGEILWDLLPGGEVLGGAPFNLAYRLHALGHTAIFVSRVGDDTYGRRALAAVKRLGLRDDWIQVDPRRPTGTVDITLDDQGKADYFIVPGAAYDAIERTEAVVEVAGGADALCFGVLAQREETSRATLRRIVRECDTPLKFLDINLRTDCYDIDSITWSLHNADILKLNDEEIGELGAMLNLSARSVPAFCAEVIDRYALSRCVVTLGDKGAFAATDTDERVYVPGVSVTIADTVGSGDAFAAGFLCATLEGRSLGEACAFGNALGALVATHSGATHPIDEAALARLLDEPGERVVEGALEEFLAEGSRSA
jgi:fructokinase